MQIAYYEVIFLLLCHIMNYYYTCDNAIIFSRFALLWLALRASISFSLVVYPPNLLIVPKPRNHMRQSNRIFFSMGARPQWRRVTPLYPRNSLETLLLLGVGWWTTTWGRSKLSATLLWNANVTRAVLTALVRARIIKKKKKNKKAKDTGQHQIIINFSSTKKFISSYFIASNSHGRWKFNNRIYRAQNGRTSDSLLSVSHSRERVFYVLRTRSIPLFITDIYLLGGRVVERM